MRYCVISFFNTPSGMYPWWDRLSNSITHVLTEINCDHFVFFRDYTENSIYPLEGRNIATSHDLNDILWLKKNIKPITEKYDHVIIHTHSHYNPLKISKLDNVTWCATEHRIGSSRDFFLKRVARKALRRFGHFPEYLIGVSEAVTKKNINMFGKRNQATILNGIHIPDVIQERAKFNSPAKNALYVGRLDEKKGIFNLVKAFNIINKSFPNLELSLTVVGGGGMWDTLLEYVTANKISDCVKLVGYSNDPSTFYRNADFLVIPTIIQEALSLASIEARVHGTPVLYANCGGLPESQIDGYSGIKLSGLSPEAIASDIIKYAQDVNLQIKLINNCRNGIEKFCEKRMIKEYLTFYSSIFSKKAKTLQKQKNQGGYV